jgi:hypothetical protein
MSYRPIINNLLIFALQTGATDVKLENMGIKPSDGV